MDSYLYKVMTKVLRKELKSLGLSEITRLVGEIFPVTLVDAPRASTLYSKWGLAGSSDAGAISIVNGEYQLKGGDWASDAGTVAENDIVRIRTLTSSDVLTETIVTLTCNTEVYVFSITTEDANRITVGGEYIIVGGEYITIGA